MDFDAPEGISAEDFSLDINGAGDVEIDGLKASGARITINGAGDCDIENLDCKTLKVGINGAKARYKARLPFHQDY